MITNIAMATFQLLFKKIIKFVDFIAIQNYIARFGHGSAKLARQAQSKEKTLKKMVDGGLTDKVASDKVGINFEHFVYCCYHFRLLRQVFVVI